MKKPVRSAAGNARTLDATAQAFARLTTLLERSRHAVPPAEQHALTCIRRGVEAERLLFLGMRRACLDASTEKGLLPCRDADARSPSNSPETL